MSADAVPADGAGVAPADGAESARAAALDCWTAAFAAADPAPAGGSLAAIAAAMAAALVAGLARRAHGWAEAGGCAAQAVLLHERLAELAAADARAYADAHDLLRQARSGPPERRDAALGRRLAHAADVPLAIAGRASDVALLAAELAERGDGDLRPDAAAAAMQAHAAAHTAAQLVAINLAMAPDDDRVARARAAADAAADAAARAESACA